MSDVIAVGPLLIRTGWLAWLVAGVGGYWFWRIVWTGSSEQRRYRLNATGKLDVLLTKRGESHWLNGKLELWKTCFNLLY